MLYLPIQPMLRPMNAQQKATVEPLLLREMRLNRPHLWMRADVKANPLDVQVAGFRQLIPSVGCLLPRLCHWMRRPFQRIDHPHSGWWCGATYRAQQPVIGDLKVKSHANSFALAMH
jgi:hypothetical protein